MSRTERAEGAIQVTLMLGVGVIAGAASWNHVINLAAKYGQKGWLAVAVAAVVETLAVSSGLEIRRRRRAGQKAGFVIAVLMASVALSLACQVAEADKSVWGWLMAAIPAVGFLVLVKMALARNSAQVPTDNLRVTKVLPYVTNARDTHIDAVGVPDDVPDEWSDPRDPWDYAVPVSPAPAPANPEPAPTDLPAVAREVAAELPRVTRDALAAGLRQRGHTVSTARASELLREVRTAP